MANRDKLLVDLFEAYYAARKNKRSSYSVMEYEVNYESRLIALADRLCDRSYTPKKSICFISFYPVQREVFAANFEDRIVHHLVYNYINHIFEDIFIHDSYSCRKNKGTSSGIKRLKKAIRGASDNYTKDAYVLKLDIKGYFMNIKKDVLMFQVMKVLNKFSYKLKVNLDFISYLIKMIIYHDPTKDAVIKGDRSDWAGLPYDKSLFNAPRDTGLPIGNLTSQLFGNIYLDGMDKYIKHKLGFRYYGRYVDDFFMVCKDKQRLKLAMKKIDIFLKENLFLDIHPGKIYFQHIKTGVKFLGVFIKPYRIYIDKRCKSAFYRKIDTIGIVDKPLEICNSYLGLMKNYDSFRLRDNILRYGLNRGYNSITMSGDRVKRIEFKQKEKI